MGHEGLSKGGNVKNRTLAKLRDGKPVYGFASGIGSSIATEALAASGIDFVFIDGQHGSFGMDRIIDCLMAIGAYPADAVARVPINDFTWIGRFLDEGCTGIVVPLVNTAEDAKKAADATRFPPIGTRSWGYGRAARYGANYTDEIDKEVFLAVQIETRTAVENAEAILSTPGVDGCWIGPSDLALSYGIHPRDRFASEVHAEAVENILQACKNTGKFAGYSTTGPEEALALASRGFQFLTVGSDAGFILKGIAAEMAQLGIDANKQEAY
jgi:4-hydroxy-2-oxoheptanedioate aldolase